MLVKMMTSENEKSHGSMMLRYIEILSDLNTEIMGSSILHERGGGTLRKIPAQGNL